MRFMMNSLNNGFARWYLMFADKADIIEPDELPFSSAAFTRKK